MARSCILSDVLPAEEERSFFQRLMGYSLQGRQEAKVFAIVHGPPNGGKSTAINACARAIGTATRGDDVTDDDDSSSVTRFYAEATPITTFGPRSTAGATDRSWRSSWVPGSSS